MSFFVVDASVAMKWFVPEIHTSDALRLRGAGHELHVPTLFDVEMANIVWKKVWRGEVSTSDASDIVNALPTLPVTRHSTLSLLADAFDLALQTQRTAYDCLYLALAIQYGGEMVTADQRLVNALQSTSFGSVRALGGGRTIRDFASKFLMNTIRVSQKAGKDGSLSLVIPLGQPEREYDVVVVVQPKEAASTTKTKTPEELGWPPGYFEQTAGSIDDETFVRPPQGELPPPVDLGLD